MNTTIKSEKGFSLVEMLFGVAIMSIMLGMAAAGLKEFDSASQNGVLQFRSYVKLIRSEAMASTLAYRVTASTTNDLTVVSDVNCLATDPAIPDNSPTAQTSLAFSLPRGANFQTSGWDFCIEPTGISDSNQIVSISDEGRSFDLELMLGGVVKLLD